MSNNHQPYISPENRPHCGSLSLQESPGPCIQEPVRPSNLRGGRLERLPDLLEPCPIYSVLRLQSPAYESCQSYRCRRSEEHTSELQSRGHLVCRLLLEKKNRTQ